MVSTAVPLPMIGTLVPPGAALAELAKPNTGTAIVAAIAKPAARDFHELNKSDPPPFRISLLDPVGGASHEAACNHNPVSPTSHTRLNLVQRTKPDSPSDHPIAIRQQAGGSTTLRW